MWGTILVVSITRVESVYTRIDPCKKKKKKYTCRTIYAISNGVLWLYKKKKNEFNNTIDI